MRRVSEDRSNVRGQGMYGSEYRNQNRGFWRGQPKPFQGPMPPARRPNILFEAGRLATEYLVSKGVLPRNVLLGKWQNGSIKDYMGEFHGVRLQEGDSSHLSSEGRPSALSRLGDPISDLVTSKKRNVDECIPDSRNHMQRGKKRMESFKNYGSDSSRETGKNIRMVSPERDGGNNSSFKYQENLKDGVDKGGLDTSSPITEEGTGNVLNEQSVKDEESFKPSAPTVASSKEEKEFSLLSLCKFAKVPTKPRSLMTGKASKFRTLPVSMEDKNCNAESHVESRIVAIPSTGSFNDMLTNQIQGSESLDSDILKEPTTVPAANSDKLITVDDDQGKQTECSHSPERNLESQNESSDNPPESANCSSSSTALEKKEKQDGGHVNSWNGTQIITDDNLCIHTGEARSVDAPLFPKDSIGPCMNYAEENQLFPASFRTCDLNLMEASEANDGFDANPLLVFQSTSEKIKVPTPMNIDLCISNNRNISDKYSRRTTDGKMVEVIDLDHDSAEEQNDHSDIKATEAVFTGLEDFPSHSKNTNDISSNHDGFGPMISELLRTDITSSSSVPQNIFLHNEIGLHNGEGILGDDDSIYMSLDEIPISFSSVWEQPTQDYHKPF